MKPSISYHLTLLVLKLKGIKKTFSQVPINYKKIRKTDIHLPKKNFLPSHTITSFPILKSTVTEIKPKGQSNQLLFFIHGGAYISGPTALHWETLKTIARHTNHTIWMCDYPKAPECKITEISLNISAIYKKALEHFNGNDICIMGDSVGGSLSISLIQQRIQKGISLPGKLIAISPLMDASISNPQIQEIDKIDPMLGKNGVLSAKKMCAENGNLSDPKLSPIHGSFKGFPETILFLAEHDITYPDQIIMVKKLTHENIKNTIIIGEKMPHIWPLLPVMREAKTATNRIISILNK